MTELILVLSLFGSSNLGNPQYQTSADAVRRAMLEMPQIKVDLENIKDNSERQFFQQTGLTVQDVAWTLYLSPAVTGVISTKPLNIRIPIGKTYVRPEIDYKIKGAPEFQATLILAREF